MGRAINMENDLDALTIRVKRIEDALEKVIETIDSMQSKSSKVKHVETTKPKKEKKNGVKEKANDEGNGSSSEQHNTRPSDSKQKS
tara:strand:- start:28 stop:285 length:258 start_codon:yes stop_codon:yes gene_type:complete